MVVFAAGAKIGTGQPLIGKSRSVSAAADGHFHRIHTGKAHRRLGPIHHIHHRLDTLFHIEIAVLHRQLTGALAILAVDKVCRSSHDCLLFFELIHIMVADDITQSALLYFTLHIRQMDKTFVTLGILGFLNSRKQTLVFHCNVLRVYHLVLSRTGMNIQAMKHHLGAGCIEILILDLTNGTAVGSVSVIRSESLYIKQIRTPADLLVGRKADLQRSMVDPCS